jgi:hypothetical protein
MIFLDPPCPLWHNECMPRTDHRNTATIADAPHETEMTMNIRELATALDTDPKTARRFMRSILPTDARPGKGATYSIDADALPTLTARFATFSTRTARTITIDDLLDD